MAAAVDNALRTALALYALDDAHGGGRLRVESRESGGVTVTALSASTPFAYAVRRRAGSSSGIRRTPSAAGSPRRRATLARSGRIETGAIGRLPRGRRVSRRRTCANLHAFAARNRTELARALADRQHRTEPDALRDLDRVLALVDLFDVGFFTSTVSPDLTRVGHGLGVVRIPR